MKTLSWRKLQFLSLTKAKTDNRHSGRMVKWAECPRKLDRLLLSRLLTCQNVTDAANLIITIIIIPSKMLIIMKFEARISG